MSSNIATRSVPDSSSCKRCAPCPSRYLTSRCNRNLVCYSVAADNSKLKAYLEGLRQRAKELKREYSSLVQQYEKEERQAERQAELEADNIRTQALNGTYSDTRGVTYAQAAITDAESFVANAYVETVARPTTTSTAVTIQSGKQPTLTRSQSGSSVIQRLEELLARQAASSSNQKQPSDGNGNVTSTSNTSPLDIVFVSAEAAPWSKSGGLGDVIGSLPVALAARGHRVMVVTPRYLLCSSPEENAKLYEGVSQVGEPVKLILNNGTHSITYHHCHRDHVDWVFVDHISYHRPGNPYGNSYGPYQDNLFRFSLLSLAACEAPLLVKVGGLRWGEAPGDPYGQDVLFVVSDWHAAMVPVYLGARYRPHKVFTNARTLLAIHNLAHQGSAPPADFNVLGLPREWFGCCEWIEGQKPSINILKAGVSTSDHVVTVSQHYAWQISRPLPEPLVLKSGGTLAPLLRGRAEAGNLTGIVNGLDLREWDPASDPHLVAHYSAHDLANKPRCKAALQISLGLVPDPTVPLLVFIGRLDYQKGPHLLLELLPSLAAQTNCQVVMLGSGAPDYEASVRQAEKDYPYNFRACVTFSVPLSHQLLGAADILLMPSLFEPCGLTQLAAMRYGALPVAHSTGGLRDTIEDYRPFAEEGSSQGLGTGFTFAPATVPALRDCLFAALTVFHHQPQRWRAMQVAAMTQDFSWCRAAEQYETVLQRMATLPAYCR